MRTRKEHCETIKAPLREGLKYKMSDCVKRSDANKILLCQCLVIVKRGKVKIQQNHRTMTDSTDWT